MVTKAQARPKTDFERWQDHGAAAYIRKLDYVLTLIPKIGTAACK